MRGGGVKDKKNKEESMKLDWSFQRGGGWVQPYNPIMSGGVWIGYFNTVPEKTARDDLNGFYVNLFPKVKSKLAENQWQASFSRFFCCNSNHVLKFSNFRSTLKHALTKIVVIFAATKSKNNVIIWLHVDIK